MITVDNLEVRKKISQSNIGVSCVPCLLLVFPNGGVEKYEGRTAIEWFVNIIQQNLPRIEEPSQPPPRTPPRQVKQKVIRQPPPVKKTVYEKTYEEENAFINEMKEDDMEDIIEEPIEDNMEDTVEEHPVLIRSGMGSYEKRGKMEGVRASTNGVPRANIREEEDSKSLSNIGAAAAAMQKEREALEKKVDKRMIF